jgi:uncharacterized iron-regulated protein
MLGPMWGKLARAALVLSLGAGALACATAGPRADWEARLAGDAIVLLGEVHDNAEQHRLRHEALARAFAKGWRPALALEQFDRERQGDIERARREKPGDVEHLIALAATPGWQWELYRPYVALALAYDVPLVAANLSRADVRRIVQEGPASIFDAAALARLGLDRAVAPDWQQAMEREIDAGHCHALPPSLWPAMARGQLARDAFMASVLREHASRGVVLLAGDGHVRRDLGVPRWLPEAERARTLAVGFLEEGNEAPPGAFDAVVVTKRAERPDPCAGFRGPREGA